MRFPDLSFKQREAISMNISRRSFLKISAAIPVIVAVPALAKGTHDVDSWLTKVPEGENYKGFDPKATYGNAISMDCWEINKEYFRNGLEVLRKNIIWSVPPECRNRIGYVIHHGRGEIASIAWKYSPNFLRRGETELSILRRLK